MARSKSRACCRPAQSAGLLRFLVHRCAPDARKSFVIAGSGEAPEGKPNYRDHIVRRGDVSPAGLAEKARWVIAEQQRRLTALGFGWGDVAATQVYTVHDIHALIATELLQCGAAASIAWHYVRPPIVDIEYEMDCRRVYRELLV